jgi:signal transduction histidine kinase
MLFALPQAQANLPIQIDVLADPAGVETIESVSRPERADEFTPSPRGLSAGYTRTVHWLRLGLEAPPGNDRLLLEVMPPYLDDLQLYLPNGTGGFTLSQSGDTHPFAARDIPARGFVFRVPFPDQTAQTLYLRVQTTSTSLVILRAWEPTAYVKALTKDYLLLGLYYGLLGAMLLFNLWHGHWRHDREHRAFLIYLLTVLVFMLAANGLVAQYFAPNQPVGHHLLSAMVMLSTAAAAHFHRCVLAIDRRTPLLNAYFLGMIGLSALCLVAQFFGYFTEAARFLTLAALFFPVLGIQRTITLWRANRLGSHFLPPAYIISLAAYLLTVLSLQGFLQGEHWQLYSFQTGTLFALLAFNLSLFDHMRQMQRQRDSALEAMRDARLARDAEAIARERQGALLAMLTHELKTPLGVIRLALDRLTGEAAVRRHANIAITDIAGVIDRCVYADRIDHGEVRIERQPCALDEILAECSSRADQSQRLRCRLPPSLPSIVSDPVLLRTICANLIDNALKYSAPGTPIDITVQAQAHSDGRPGLALSIANTPGAAGVPDPARLFQRYHREAAAHAQTGSGLGLHLVKQLSLLIGAEIIYHPPLVDGQLRFSLWLPLEMP